MWGNTSLAHAPWGIRSGVVSDDLAAVIALHESVDLAGLLEVLSPDVTGGNAFPVHQELIVRNGVRIGESFVTDGAIADGVYEGMLVATPENVPGATCGSMAPVLLA